MKGKFRQVKAASGYFVLRRDDGVLMPGFKGRAGGTYVNPDDPATHDGTPRLFTSQKAAGDALRWWSKGHVRKQWSSAPFDSIFEGPEVTGLHSAPVAGRNAADWTIWPCELTITAH